VIVVGPGADDGVNDSPDAEAFDGCLCARPGAIAVWFAGHTHAPAGSTISVRPHVERRWAVTFVTCATLTRDHFTARSEVVSPRAEFSASRPTAAACRFGAMYTRTTWLMEPGFRQEEIHIPLHRPFQPAILW
jgi:hypothetical protein